MSRPQGPLETSVTVRGHELDSFGHVNHTVFLSYLEHARFRTPESGGFPTAEITARGWGVHVARVKVDYHREAFLGHELRVRTSVGGPFLTRPDEGRDCQDARDLRRAHGRRPIRQRASSYTARDDGD